MRKLQVLKFLLVFLFTLLTSCGGSSGGGGEDPYPVTTEIQKLLASDAQPDDWFGRSVAISGDYAIVGAELEDGGADDTLINAGAAYVFRRTGPDTWEELTKLVAPDAQAYDFFGQSVAISGDYAIVGTGAAAYVFHRTGPDTWDAGTKFETGFTFGNSVAISGDYAIVGAYAEPGDDGSGYPVRDAGAAYVFHRTGPNTWDAGTRLIAPDAQIGDFFGYSVAISGDYVIVGAFSRNADTGVAYVFHRTGPNTWDAGTTLVAPDLEGNDQFGHSVAISGDYAIVGAPHEDGGAGSPMSNAGAAYVFQRTGLNTWDAGTKLAAPDAQAYDWFGFSVAISGDYAIVGAPVEDGGLGSPLLDSGVAYVFHRTGPNTWEAGTKLGASDVQAQDHFGFSVAISGVDAIVGALEEDGGAGDPLICAGAAYIF